jgi:hypothetical protein
MKMKKTYFLRSLFFFLAGFLILSASTNSDTPPGEKLYDIKLKLKERSSNLSYEYDSNNDHKAYAIRLKESKPNTLLISLENKRQDISLIDVTQDNPKKTYKVNPLKMTILGVAAAGVFTGFHIYYSNTWWKDQRDYFKYAADGYYARNMDKASHIFTANFFTVATATAYEWAGVSPDKALLYGAITSMAYETYIEINDGFAPIWGFDWGDMGANIVGAVYPFLQNEVKPLENINFKWSFHPDWLKKKTAAGDDLLDDYTNMTFWMSVNPMIVLPKSVTDAKFYPKFLAIAIGMGLQNASHSGGSQFAETKWILSLDWDVNKLPGNSDFMKKLKKILNFYHFPAPAVKISPSGVWYGLYF